MMKRYLQIMGTLITLFLILFVIVEALGIPLLTDPQPWLDEPGALAGLIGVGLLVIDVFLPVPSSLVMIAHGALYGIAVGSLLSLIGSLLAAWVGFAVGRQGGSWLRRLVPEGERDQVETFVARWGLLAVLVSRPVPLLAETAAIMAGASSMGWGRFSIASLLGSIPAALLYAYTGATAARLDNGLLVFGLVMAVAGVVWLVGRRSGGLEEPGLEESGLEESGLEEPG